MASRRLFSSLLRSSLRRSPPEFQSPNSSRPFSSAHLASPLSPMAVARTFCPSETFTRFKSGNGLVSVLRSFRLASLQQAAVLVPPFRSFRLASLQPPFRSFRLASLQQAAVLVPPFCSRFMSTETNSVGSSSEDSSIPEPDMPPPRIKFKRLDKTARHIMQILDKEAVEDVRAQREIPEIKPGYIVQLKVEVPENKRRVSIIKGIVIARHNAGLNSTFRIRRLVAGVGVESLFPLYSPNIKEIKVLDKKKVRRAKLYYLREKMNALKKQ